MTRNLNLMSYAERKSTMDGDFFEIPVVLFIFKRDKAVEIIRRIKAVQPRKLYILADQGRNDEEILQANKCRKLVEQEITWNCEVVKKYATHNIGVYENIGIGAKWVLERERWAIFLEDDNLPELSFFYFCEELLKKYENDTRILWICGTNYLGRYQSKCNDSYVFTKHMLPCGWASWSSKFPIFYDGELSLCSNSTVMGRISMQYCNKAVYKQYRNKWTREYERIQNGERPKSWDYQMDLSIKANSLYGICPCNNLIKNIGVDKFSVHGGGSFDDEMTRRFCGMDSYPLEFPLIHPQTVLTDPYFEKKIGKIILLPLNLRIKIAISRMVKKVFRIPSDMGIKEYLRKKIHEN